MKFEIDNKEKVSVIKSKVEKLDALEAPEFKSEFVMMNKNDVRNIILDLSETRYCDSSGLSAILTANRLWKRLGSFVLTGVSHPATKKLIEISRLDTVLTIVPTVKESIEYVMMETIERQINAEPEDEAAFKMSSLI